VAAVATKNKSKFDKTPADFQGERSTWPQAFYPDGKWAGFMVSEEVAAAWCKQEKGRYYNWIALPKIERVKSSVKKPVRRIVKGRKPTSMGIPAPKRGKSRSVAPTVPQTIEWDASDIEDEQKLSEVAEKSKQAAIKKLKGKK
jgi:hypothetical protein